VAALLLSMCLTVTSSWAQESGDMGPPVPDMDTSPESSSYDASWSYAATLTSNAAGDSATIHVGISNTGTETWEAGGSTPTELGYVWLDDAGNVLSLDTALSPISDDVPPGSTVSEVLNVTNPPGPGQYTLRIGLVRDGVWFQMPTHDLSVLDVGVTISPAPVTNTSEPTPTVPAPETATPAPIAAAPALHVSGNRIVNAGNQAVTLVGVNRADTANMCLHGRLNVAPVDLASVQAIASWHVTVVRVPLNEDCWLGVPGLPAATGLPYRTAIIDYVQLLNQQGIAVILSDTQLHLDSKGKSVLQDMPDSTKTPRFWTSVASAFIGNDSVMFGLWGEPIPGTVADTTAAWTCLRDGGNCPGLPVTGGGPAYRVAGMQQLVNTVRATGATNILLIPGVRGDNVLTHWLAFAPTDPLHNMAASWHSYPHLLCNTQACWDAQIAPVAAKVPLIADEIGEGDCLHNYIDRLMPWLDAHQINYLAWSWWVGDCAATFSLISDYDGTATDFGVGFRDHLVNLPALSR
jgi:endoglucanase